MKIQYLFYVIGVFFIFASVLYFTSEFIELLSDPIKLILLIAATIITFVVAELLRGGNK